MSILSKREYNRYFKKLGKEIEFASSVALNDAAFDVANALNLHAGEVFEGGATTFTQKSFSVLRKANKGNLEALVGARQIQDKYLSKAILGGDRQAGKDYATGKQFVVVPGSGAKKNKFGNLARNYLRNQTKRKDTFIGTAIIKGKPSRGVYKRPTKADRRAGRNKPKVIALLKRKTEYKTQTRFDLFNTSNKQFNITFRRSMNEAVRDIRKHGKVLSSFKRKQVK